MDPTDLARTVGRYAYVEAITVTNDGRLMLEHRRDGILNVSRETYGPSFALG
jgi:hypothetical protein